MLTVMIVVISLLALLAVSYILYLHKQLSSINHQLLHRLAENTRQPVHLQLVNLQLNQLVANVNRCLNQEEKARLQSLREQQYYKEMIANLSHDFRTPLTAIKGHQQLLLAEDLSFEQQAKLQVSQKHVIVLEQMIETFFEYSYLTSNNQQMQYETVNIQKIVVESLAGAFSEFEKRHMAVHFVETAPIIISSDPEMVTRIIQNLIRNCLMHAKGDLSVHLHKESERVIISFTNPLDSTIEIDVHRLFERFYTPDQSRRKGTGLGLSIIKVLTGKLNGTATAKIEDGLFTIEIGLPITSGHTDSNGGYVV